MDPLRLYTGEPRRGVPGAGVRTRARERRRGAAHTHTHAAPRGDEIHHGTGDVLLMVTVGDPGWAGCVRDAVLADVGLAPVLLRLPLSISSPRSSSVRRRRLARRKTSRRVRERDVRRFFGFASPFNLGGIARLRNQTTNGARKRLSISGGPLVVEATRRRRSSTGRGGARGKRADRFTSELDAVLYDSYLVARARARGASTARKYSDIQSDGDLSGIRVIKAGKRGDGCAR